MAVNVVQVEGFYVASSLPKALFIPVPDTYSARRGKLNNIKLKKKNVRAKHKSSCNINREEPPVAGRQHLSIQTEQYLEELCDAIEEADVECETDPYFDLSPSTKFVPEKPGHDAETQIFPGELFDFDEEVKPILEILVNKTLEESLIELMAEEDLRELEAIKSDYKRRIRSQMESVKQLEEQERLYMEEKKKIEERMQLENETAEKIAACIYSQSYLDQLMPDVYRKLETGGFFDVEKSIVKELKETFLPNLIDKAEAEIISTQHETEKPYDTGATSVIEELEKTFWPAFINKVNAEIAKITDGKIETKGFFNTESIITKELKEVFLPNLIKELKAEVSDGKGRELLPYTSDTMIKELEKAFWPALINKVNAEIGKITDGNIETKGFFDTESIITKELKEVVLPSLIEKIKAEIRDSKGGEQEPYTSDTMIKEKTIGPALINKVNAKMAKITDRKIETQRLFHTENIITKELKEVFLPSLIKKIKAEIGDSKGGEQEPYTSDTMIKELEESFLPDFLDKAIAKIAKTKSGKEETEIYVDTRTIIEELKTFWIDLVGKVDAEIAKAKSGKNETERLFDAENTKGLETFLESPIVNVEKEISNRKAGTTEESTIKELEELFLPNLVDKVDAEIVKTKIKELETERYFDAESCITKDLKETYLPSLIDKVEEEIGSRISEAKKSYKTDRAAIEELEESLSPVLVGKVDDKTAKTERGNLENEKNFYIESNITKEIKETFFPRLIDNIEAAITDRNYEEPHATNNTTVTDNEELFWPNLIEQVDAEIANLQSSQQILDDLVGDTVELLQEATNLYINDIENESQERVGQNKTSDADPKNNENI